MTCDLVPVLDGARYVAVDDSPGEFTEMAVWHGGHSINFYVVGCEFGTIRVNPTTVRNVGDFAEDAATLEEVREAIADEFGRDHEGEP